MCPFKNKLIKICILICPLNGRASFYYVSVSLYAFRNNNVGVILKEPLYEYGTSIQVYGIDKRVWQMPDFCTRTAIGL